MRCVRSYALKILQGDIQSVEQRCRATRREATNRALQGDLGAGLSYEAILFAALFATEDQKEGMSAFAEKREPEFKGR